MLVCRSKLIHFVNKIQLFVVTLAGSLVAASGASLVHAVDHRMGAPTSTLLAATSHSWFVAAPSKNIAVPLVAFIAVASGILIISGAGFLYFKYIRTTPPPPPNWQQNSSAGYTNNGFYTPQDEAVIVKPTAVTTSMSGQYPSINQAGDMPHLSAADAVAQVVLDRLAQPKPVLQYNQSAPQNAMPVYNSIFDTPQHNVPAWQNQLKINQATQSDAPKDMFEIAKEHPETFGSTQLYQAQQAKPPSVNKADNE